MQGKGATVEVQSICLARRGFVRVASRYGWNIASPQVHPKIVSEMLGHSQINITLDLYSHVTPTLQRQAAAAVDDLLSL